MKTTTKFHWRWSKMVPVLKWRDVICIRGERLQVREVGIMFVFFDGRWGWWPYKKIR